ncbi:rust resistance kinase Lr10-like [Rhododendron vialii]|uniref:rust resistance kinase Lr10-like n=1 Tax=Rhododendron vialii TaxID=182163 RepID=UPI00265F6D0A|nr:rust resistance kinase Lr10-like [Rhododendron vialii]
MFKYRHRISAILNPAAYDGENHMTGIEINAKEFVKTYQSTLVTNYSYSDIKKMTTGFKEKLGEGGYGTVYKGRLSDGRLIAVKLLENYKDKGQNFLNEVTTIGRIHHVNVIRLLGFCWDGSKQALIYEYMPNKSLGDQMFQGERSVSLGLAKLLEIAIGVAHGIEYLHNGCDSRILHLDIKPQNVLLDQNFNPKISDFGLAKVYSRNRSAITMTGARGTIGYIAPEIFLRNLGNPSHKSDVYSFGMLLLEMIGVSKRVEVKPDVNTSSSEAYFPGWVYDRLIEEKEMDLERGDSIVGEEVFIARKMVMVGLWCIQMNPKDRPSMTRVVEMLCGDMEAIEMPPKPLFFSPPRVHVEQEITSLESETSELPLTSEVVVRSHDN